ncbi:hypothetical protein DXG01_011186, partial [Tephrocybe rancida]
MDAAYDKEKAKQILERLVGEASTEDETCLNDLLKDPEWFESVHIKELTKDKAYGLVCADSQGQPTDEECVFTVYGALAKKDLLPLKLGVRQLDAGRVRFLKQFFRLDGLGTQQFCAAIEATTAVCELFNRVFEEGTLEHWKDGLPGDEDKLLDMSNKIVTQTAEAHDQEHVPFEASNDPAGVMEALLQKGFIRTEDNIVQYSEGKLGLEGKR